MSIKKIKSILIPFLLILFIVTASGFTSTSFAAKKNSKDTSTLKITMGFIANPHDKKFINDEIRMFEKINPDIKVTLQITDVTVEGGKLTTMLNSGVDTPDVINVNSGPSRVGMLAQTGIIQPLNALYAKYGWEQKLNPGAYDFIYRNNNNVYEVPNTQDAIEVYYNKDIFKKLGLSVPKTYKDFLNICDKIKTAGTTPISLGARNGYAVGWIYGNILESTVGGATVKDLIANKIKWNNPKIVKATQNLSDMVKAGYIDKASASKTDADALYAFLDQKAAMYFVGTWFITSVYTKNMQDKLGMFTLPSVEDGIKVYPTSGLGNSWVVPTKVKNTAAAGKWLDFVLSKNFTIITSVDPALSNIYTSKAASSVSLKGRLIQNAVKSIEKGAGYNPSVFIGVETKNAYYQNLQGVLGNMVSPNDAMDNIQAAAEKDIASASK